MEMLALEWGGRAGALWDVAKLEPCCGDPCNPADGAKCLACWYCFGTCSLSKLFAHSVGQDCAVVNHVLPTMFCNGCVAIATRHNIRVKHGAGPKAGDVMGIVGDVLVLYFCGPCAFCQILRAVDNDSWDWLGHIQSKQIKIMDDPFVFLTSSGGGEHQTIV